VRRFSAAVVSPKCRGEEAEATVFQASSLRNKPHVVVLGQSSLVPNVMTLPSVARTLALLLSGAFLFIVAGLSSLAFLVDRDCGAAFGYYGCQPEIAHAVARVPYTLPPTKFPLLAGAFLLALIVVAAIGAMVMAHDRSWRRVD
jgi:hypothetical protein